MITLFICCEQLRGRFVSSSSEIGEKALNAPICRPTTDEINSENAYVAGRGHQSIGQVLSIAREDSKNTAKHLGSQADDCRGTMFAPSLGIPPEVRGLLLPASPLAAAAAAYGPRPEQCR